MWNFWTSSFTFSVFFQRTKYIISGRLYKLTNLIRSSCCQRPWKWNVHKAFDELQTWCKLWGYIISKKVPSYHSKIIFLCCDKAFEQFEMPIEINPKLGTYHHREFSYILKITEIIFSDSEMYAYSQLTGSISFSLVRLHLWNDKRSSNENFL